MNQQLHHRQQLSHRLDSTDKKALCHGFLYAGALCCAALLGSAMAFTTSASAQSAPQATVKNQIALSSEVYVVRIEQNADGGEKIVLKTPQQVIVVPGDRLKFVLTYTNSTGEEVTGFKATNPMPAAVQFGEAAEDWAQVSIDDGKTWGKLSDFTVDSFVQDSTPIVGDEDSADLDQAADLAADQASVEAPIKQSSAMVARAATSADVTHVRWVFAKPIAVNESGSVSFEGFVK